MQPEKDEQQSTKRSSGKIRPEKKKCRWAMIVHANRGNRRKSRRYKDEERTSGKEHKEKERRVSILICRSGGKLVN